MVAAAAASALNLMSVVRSASTVARTAGEALSWIAVVTAAVSVELALAFASSAAKLPMVALTWA